MAKLTGPIFSESASGKLGQILLHSKQKSGQVCRKLHKPHTPPSLAQYTQRFLIGLCTARWQIQKWILEPVYKVIGNRYDPPMTAFNAYVKAAIDDPLNILELVAYWSFNENSGSAIPDYSKNGYHGYLHITYPTNCPKRIESINTRFGKALNFNGISHAVATTNKITMAFTYMTLIALVRTTQTTWGTIFSRRVWNYADSFGMYIENVTGKVAFGRWTPPVYSTIPVNDGKWHFVAGTQQYLGGSNYRWRIYLDGKLNNTKDNTLGVAASTYAWAIGATPTGTPYWYKGDLDNILLFKRRLNDDEILKVYNIMREAKQRQKETVI